MWIREPHLDLGVTPASISDSLYLVQEHADIETQVRALGQKYMGVRPQKHQEEMFRDTSIRPEGDGHPVPVSNFLNAQCMC